jgi:hypothetical protein
MPRLTGVGRWGTCITIFPAPRAIHECTHEYANGLWPMRVFVSYLRTALLTASLLWLADAFSLDFAHTPRESS